MKALRLTLAAALAAAIALPLQAGEGELGMKAPKLEISKWVKGEAVDVTAGDKVYVVEFWATWCPPCRESIPHLTEMAKKYKGKAVFVGISDEEPATVEKFVEKMGDKMDYVVAIDDEDKTGEAYMRAFDIRGIPHAFVVDKSGAIVWHDHPMAELDEVVEQVIAGKFDAEAGKKRMREREQAMKELMETYQLVQQYFELAESAGKEAEASEVGQRILTRIGDNRDGAMMLNELAWRILTETGIQNRDVKLALTAAEKANTATGDNSAAVLDTYALALYENGEKQKAVDVQRRAVKRAEEQGASDMVEELKSRLERFEKGE